MGYSCTQAALRTLQAVKNIMGGNLDASNGIWISERGAPALECFFERGDERDDGAIVGTVYYPDGRSAPFCIAGDGSIVTFPGLNKGGRSKVEALVRDPHFRPTVAVI